MCGSLLALGLNVPLLGPWLWGEVAAHPCSQRCARRSVWANHCDLGCARRRVRRHALVMNGGDWRLCAAGVRDRRRRVLMFYGSRTRFGVRRHERASPSQHGSIRACAPATARRRLLFRAGRLALRGALFDGNADDRRGVGSCSAVSQRRWRSAAPPSRDPSIATSGLTADQKAAYGRRAFPSSRRPATRSPERRDPRGYLASRQGDAVARRLVAFGGPAGLKVGDLPAFDAAGAGVTGRAFAASMRGDPLDDASLHRHPAAGPAAPVRRSRLAAAFAV